MLNACFCFFMCLPVRGRRGVVQAAVELADRGKDCVSEERKAQDAVFCFSVRSCLLCAPVFVREKQAQRRFCTLNATDKVNMLPYFLGLSANL
jgi:hypothetical protein